MKASSNRFDRGNRIEKPEAVAYDPFVNRNPSAVMCDPLASAGDGSEPRSTQVGIAVNRNIDAAERLEKIVAFMEDRLAPVLRPAEGKDLIGTNAPSQVELAEVLDRTAGRVSAAVNRLSDIIDRLEL